MNLTITDKRCSLNDEHVSDFVKISFEAHREFDEETHHIVKYTPDVVKHPHQYKVIGTLKACEKCHIGNKAGEKAEKRNFTPLEEA